MTALFEGTGTALATPFKANGTIDYAAFERLVDYQINGGVEALVVCGSTGESATMTYDEKCELIRRTVAQAAHAGAGRPQVIAGTGSNVTDETIRLTIEASQMGVDGVLLVSPYYNKPSQRGLLAHFGAIAAAVPETPLILYNVPARTGSNIAPETVLRLANEHPNIAAIKEASADIDQCCEIINHAPDGFRLYSGEDSVTLPLLAVGARGVIAVVSNQVPTEFGEMVRSALAGDYATARRLHLRLHRLMRLNFIESNPVPVKAALAMMGIFSSAVYRLPLVPLAAEHAETMRAELHELGLLQEIETPMENDER